jgi:hypothetical protein
MASERATLSRFFILAFFIRQLGITRPPIHPLAPGAVKMAHALFVVNGRISISIYLMPAMKEATLACPLIHSRLLRRDSQKILMKVSTKWPPDRIVVSLANQALFWSITLEP